MTGHGKDDGLESRRRIAAKLGLAERPDKPGQFEGHCPECGRRGFSIANAGLSRRFAHMWSCPACLRNCGKARMPAVLRAALLRAGVRPAWLGDYGLDLSSAADQAAAARLGEAVDFILSWPGLDPAQMRLMLAEARGDKIPDEYREFARFAQGIGVGRRNSYYLAEEYCRPAGSPPVPGEGVEDQS